MLDRQNERRRDERFLLSLPVALVRGKRREPLFTEDVSFRGLFLRIDKPPAVHQLVQLEVELPPSGKIVPVHARVVRARPSEGRPPSAAGVGVELHALAGEARSLWEEFVRSLMPKGRPAAVAVPVAGRLERHGADLRLLLGSPGELEALLAAHLAHDVVFVPTAIALPVGHAVRVTLVHPVTAATHALDCMIAWRDVESVEAGVGLELAAMDDVRTAGLRDFIGEEPPQLSASLHDVEQALVEQWEEEEPTNVLPVQPRK
jgi:Tfp pilus assembly protein PilZ